MSDRGPTDVDDEPPATDNDDRETLDNQNRDTSDNRRESAGVERGAGDSGDSSAGGSGNSRRLGSSGTRRGRRQYDSDAASESNPLGPFVVALVGGSAGLIGLQSGATLAQIGLIVLAGAAVGAVLWLYLRRLGREMPSRRVRR